MIKTFFSEIWRPIIASASIGALLMAGLIWLFVAESSSRQVDADWVAHTTHILRLLRELEEQVDNKVDLEDLLNSLQAETMDNESQQRRLSQLRAGKMDVAFVLTITNAMRGEEHRLLSERVSKWRNDGRGRDWLTAVVLGLLSLSGTGSLWLIIRMTKKRSQSLDVLALTTEKIIGALPDSKAYEDLRNTMAEVRASLRGRQV